MLPRDALPDVTREIVRRFDPLRVVLFGSAARGEAREGGDLDLLVVLPDSTDRRQAAIAIRRALRHLPVSKDVVVTTPEQIERRGRMVGTVLRSALRDGEVLYERAAA